MYTTQEQERTKVEKSKLKKLTVSLASITCFLLAVVFLANSQVGLKQVVYTTFGKTTEYGIFGATLYSKSDRVHDPKISGKVKSEFEEAGIDVFLKGTNPTKDWTAYKIVYRNGGRLGLILETTESQADVLDHYRAVLGPEDRIIKSSSTHVDTLADWDFNGNNSFFVRFSPTAKRGTIEIQIDLFRTNPIKNVGVLNPQP